VEALKRAYGRIRKNAAVGVGLVGGHPLKGQSREKTPQH
jgi:hypothetical protein